MDFDASDWMHRPKGGIEVVCGSMFSGKTEELIRRLKRAGFAHQKIEIFKPAIDVRYDTVRVVSHDEKAVNSTPVQTASEILLHVSDAEVVGIDEAQFFGEDLAEVCTLLANRGIRVIIAGLDMDFEGKPFGPMPQLMAIAESVTKVHAVCVKCGNPAQFSHRFSGSKSLVQLGETDSYEPLCRRCYLEATGQTEKE
ncbi:MAG: thymidine kinase [Bacteroidales bacterium]|nr:thymidine kinase [Bacteroidales bacterium]MDE6694609.1 thymidine kinase [Bacteroidales bacterium]